MFASSLTTTFAVLVPTSLGVNVTYKVQLAPDARLDNAKHLKRCRWGHLFGQRDLQSGVGWNRRQRKLYDQYERHLWNPDRQQSDPHNHRYFANQQENNCTNPAGTPETYKSSLVFGGTGGGLTNYTGFFSTGAGVVPTIAPMSISPSSAILDPQRRALVFRRWSPRLEVGYYFVNR